MLNLTSAVLAVAVTGLAGGADAAPGRESFVMGRFSFTNLQPVQGNYRVLSYKEEDGLAVERFLLTAAKGRFVYYSAGPERQPLIEGRITNLQVHGLKRNRVLESVEPFCELEGLKDDMTFVLRPETGSLVVTPLLGGAVTIQPQRVWVGNAGAVSITPTSASGSIYFDAADVGWSGIQVHLPDSLGSLTIDARTDDPAKGARFLLDFASGSLGLQSGSFSWRSGRRWESSTSLVAQSARLDVGSESVAFDIRHASLPAAGLVLGKDLAAPVVTPGTFAMAALEGRADRVQGGGSILAMTTTAVSLASSVVGSSAVEIEALPLVQAAIGRGSIGSAEAGRQAAIMESAAALASLDRIDFALHVPVGRLRSAFGDAVSRAGNGIAGDLGFGEQQIRIGLRFDLSLAGMSVPVALAVLVAPSLDGQTIVLHPSIQVAVPGPFKAAGPMDLTDLLAGLRAGVSDAIARAKQVEVRLPMDLSVVKRLDPTTIAGSSPNLTIGGTAVEAKVAIPRAVLLIDDAGLHVAGKLEVSL